MTFYVENIAQYNLQAYHVQSSVQLVQTDNLLLAIHFMLKTLLNIIYKHIMYRYMPFMHLFAVGNTFSDKVIIIFIDDKYVIS